MLLPWLAVVFAGILGNGNPEASRIAKEVLAAVEEKAHLEPITIPARDLAAIVHHASGVGARIAALGADGLVAGELVAKKRVLTLRLIVYAGDGSMRSLSEITLKNRALGRDDFVVIRQNLAAEAATLGAKGRGKARPAPVDTAAATPDRDVAMGTEEAAPGVDTGGSASEPAPARTWNIVKANLGFGIIARSFTPGDTTIRHYDGSPVGSISLGVQLRPWRKVALDAGFDRTLVMHSNLAAETPSTSITRVEVAGNLLVTTGKTAVALRGGLGYRGFAIATDSLERSPDRAYTYLIAGATVSAALSPKAALRVAVALEPVVGGDTGWAIDGAAALDLRLATHLFGRIGADLQRFSSGGAADLYPTVIGSLGAAY